MPTFKQLEALRAIADLGSFEGAARELHTTQSAISKRIKELEQTFGQAVFDRSGRAAQLTPKGEEMLELAEALLAQRERFIRRMTDPARLKQRIRIGVTEMTAMTWLARWAQAIQREFPKLSLEPEVLPSNELRERLAASRLDLIVVPDAAIESSLDRVEVGDLHHAWYCRPGLLAQNALVSKTELRDMAMVTQAHPASGSQPLAELLKDNGIVMQRTLIANNVLSIIALTLAGFGVSYLPRDFMKPLVAQGRVIEFRIDVRLPPIAYVALHRQSEGSIFPRLAAMAGRCCDFGAMFQSEPSASG
ncbi:MAG: LysR family transcriptional regulator [Pseudomonadota bacterium]